MAGLWKRVWMGFLACGLLGAADAKLVKGPYLAFTGKGGEMRILVQTDAQPARLKATWQTEGRRGTRSVEATKLPGDFMFAFSLGGLAPGWNIAYRLEIDGVVKNGTFRAPRGSDREAITFYGLGDTRTYPADFERVAKAMLRDMAEAKGRNTFAVHVGDFVTRGQRAHEWNEHFFAPAKGDGIRRLLASIPVLPVIGNHEGAEGLPPMKTFWPLPLAGRSGWYYGYDHGPVHVAVVDTESGEPFVPGSAQYEWLEQDLRASKAPLKIVAWHGPAYSAGGGHLDYPLPKQHLAPLCEKYGVPIVLCGDNHYYARILVNGVQHLTSGGGGAPLYAPDPKTPHFQAGTKTYQFTRFEVLPGARKVRVTAVDVQGKVIDQFEVKLRPR